MVGAVGAQSTRAFWQRSIFVSTENSGGQCRKSFGEHFASKIVEMRHSMQVSVDMFGSFLPDFAFSFGSVDHMDPNRVCLCHTCSKSRENVPRYWLDF